MKDSAYDNQIILINKPKGLTSFDVIKILRKKTNIKKIGHAGTLDPLAEGLMIIGFGEATKKLSGYFKLDKEYIADILIGIHTDTYDMEGKILKTVCNPNLNKSELLTALKEILGKKEFKVPPFSAKKIKGRKLYELARKGILNFSQIPYQKMVIYNANVISLKKYNEYQIAKIHFHVSSGTYIRSIVIEIGKLIKLPTTLYSLKRTKIGEFKLECAIDLSSI